MRIAATRALIEQTTGAARHADGCHAHGRFLGRVCVLSFRTSTQIDAADLAPPGPRGHRSTPSGIHNQHTTDPIRASARDAIETMRARGLDPIFGARSSPRWRRSRAAAHFRGADARPARLAWCSIDNGLFPDLDQRRCQRRCAARHQNLVAIADVDARCRRFDNRSTRRAQHHFVYTPGWSFRCCPRGCPPISRRSTSGGIAWAIVIGIRRLAAGEARRRGSTARCCTITRSSPITRWAPG